MHWGMSLVILACVCRRPVLADDKVNPCRLFVSMSRELSFHEADDSCRRLYHGRLLDAKFGQRPIAFPEVKVKDVYWINGSLIQNGVRKPCYLMKCKWATKRTCNANILKERKVVKCKCKDQKVASTGARLAITGFACQTGCQHETTTHLYTTTEPVSTTYDVSLVPENSSNSTTDVQSNQTSQIPISQIRISQSPISQSPISQSPISQFPFSHVPTFGSTPDPGSGRVKAQQSEDRDKGGTSFWENLVSPTNKVSYFGLMIGGATTAVNVIFILILLKCKSKRRTKRRRRIVSADSTSSFSFRSMTGKHENKPSTSQTTKRRHSDVLPRPESPYEVAGFVRRSSTPVISEMSSTSRYDNPFVTRNDSSYNVSAHACLVPEIIVTHEADVYAQPRKNTRTVTNQTTASRDSDDYYKLEKLKTSTWNTLQSRSLSDSCLSSDFRCTVPSHRIRTPSRLTFGVEDRDFPARLRTSEHFASDPNLLPPMFQFQLSWASDSESYFFEMESSSVVGHSETTLLS